MKREKKNPTLNIRSVGRMGCGEWVNEIHYRKSMSKEHIAADCQSKRTCISALRQARAMHPHRRAKKSREDSC